MTILVAAVVLVGLLGLANLLFSWGVMRRLREHTELLNSLGNPDPATVMLPAGGTVEDFATVSPGGSGVLLVGFFSVGCTHCTTQLPKFAERAQNHPRTQVLAVVVADEQQDPRPYADQLAPIARVLHEEPAGPIAHAFRVTGFPAMALVGPDGTVLASGSQVTALDAATVRV